MEERNFVSGTVAAIFFENPGNFYKVMLIDIAETNTGYNEPQIVVTGSFGDISEDTLYQFYGDLVEHARYGLQFQVESYSQNQPTSENGLINYFASEKFPGVGPKTAEKIVTTLGVDAIKKIVADASVLESIAGLTEKKQQQIAEIVRANQGMDEIVVGLSQYGFGSQLSFAIYQMYHSQALSIIEENPYQLVEDIDGIGFKKADQLAEQLGIAATSEKRLRAAVLHQVFQSSLQSGDTYIEADRLLDETLHLLEKSRPVEINPEQLADVIIALTEEDKIQQEATRIYENSLYFAEIGIASSIQRMLKRKKEIKYPEKTIDKKLAALEKDLGIQYGTSQIEAIKAALASPLFILTGGPGTGKTTVINGIVQLFAELNDLSLDPLDYTQEVFPILLAAPTGRAAKRMNETTGLPSGTIHRLLGLTGREKAGEMEINELVGGLLIVDEMSMLDTWLANSLLKAIPNNMQVIFVGDKDQLPSVGPGQVLHDLLAIKEIPQRELTDIYRQGDGSTIISLAHEIKNGHLPADFTQNKADRSFFPCHAQQIEPLIAQIVTKAKAKGFTAQDIQLLAPMYRGPAGIDALNKMMQEIFNPNDGTKKEVSFHDQVYRIGDKVLQLVNSPEDNVFNGDMGQIVGIILAKDSEDKVDELVIQFDANEVTYKRNDWQKITLSYCCSIHKSQGSEFEMVILPMVYQYQRMLQRNLLYTAVTRSKDKLILLGESQAFQTCVANQSANRLTTLTQRIEVLTTSKVADLSITEPSETNEPSKTSEKTKTAVSAENQKQRQPLTYESEISLTADAVSKTPANDLVEENDTTKENLAADLPLRFILTKKMVRENAIDPLIGMEGLSPMDFM
ncbi:SF1B family DNA helicase RecD2 [Enterococcus canintestini]|uniref:ATP-dependent RecD2 DNA helicase n=1 Tax=Enterococcus canintestini TaxID=317010 RepID=A0A267HPL0_9ENTE|nr:ATP-dependent RecD-like DNA helicase [Enterococcus canintestini]PAB00192.1 exodeoxyribonuclease V subunit alpha [Enterococcus canintestini]